MMVSTKGRYALRVMIDLAEHDDGLYIPLKEIAARQDISEKYLESIVKLLTRNGDLVGVRGKGGGYRLTRSPEEYTVGSILRLTEGGLAPVGCPGLDSRSCDRAEDCRTLPMWRELDKLINDYLESPHGVSHCRHTSRRRRHGTRHIQVNPLAAIPSSAVISADHPDSLTVFRDAKLFGRFTRNTQKTHNLFLLLDVLN